MSGGENNVSLDLPELQPTVSEYEEAKRDYEQAKRVSVDAKIKYNKTKRKYDVLIAHPNICKVLHIYAKFHDKPVETISVMDLMVSSTMIEVFDEDLNGIVRYLPKLRSTLSDYEISKRDYKNARCDFGKANFEYIKTKRKYNVLIAHPNISKALHNYAKFHDKPVVTVSVMDLMASSAKVKGWFEAHIC
jgi:hypothetical protein